MKDLRFSIAALATLTAFSLYLIGINEAEEPYTLLSLTFLPIVGIMLLITSDD
jgi:hypothetical protein